MAGELNTLLDQLRSLPVEGPSRGGPYVGIQPNELTRAIVAQGPAAIPAITSRLDSASWSEAVYLVFLLRELHAAAARQAVEALRDSARFEGTPHDMTLDMQINYFLRDVDSW